MKYVLLVVGLFACLPAFGKDRLSVNMQRVVGIDDGISRNMDAVQAKLLEFAKDASKGPIDIVIDSPGGSVFTGFQFVNAMEEVKGKGITLRCFVSGVAASMAFQILVHCNERYALSRSFLLWHGVRTEMRDPITSAAAAALHADLASIDKVIMKELNDSLGLSKEEILFHFNQETLHIGDNLAAMCPGFISTYAYIPNLSEALHSKDVVRNSASSAPFFSFGGNADEGIQYIYRGR
jgi:ATP-dependent protease ClpP protease subunit